MDFPSLVGKPEVLHTVSSFATAQDCETLLAISTGAFDWPSANRAIYIPFSIPWPYKISRALFANGTTTTGSNVDIGIYTVTGVRLVSIGSTAMGTASTITTVSGLDYLLTPGAYYLAMACDGTTARGFGLATVATSEGRLAGLLQQDSALPLPATATFAQWASTGYPLFGIAV